MLNFVALYINPIKKQNKKKKRTTFVFFYIVLLCVNLYLNMIVCGGFFLSIQLDGDAVGWQVLQLLQL